MTWKFFIFHFQSSTGQKCQENFEACWSVKKLLKPTRASRTFTGRFYSINQDLHFLILNVISSKCLFFKTLDDMKVFYFSFPVQHFKSVKKIWSLLERQELLKPTRASRTFTGRFYSINQDLHFVILNLISSKWLFFKTLDGMKVFFLFFVSSPALQKRQENFEACWSVKKIWSPAGASRNF